jgi:hypothetical protein
MVVLSTEDGKTWQLGDTLFQPIDGTFPNWKRVVPDQTPEALSVADIWFEPKYQLALHKAAKEIDAICDIHPNGQNSALVHFHNGENDCPMFGVIMPYRKIRKAFKKPSWA